MERCSNSVLFTKEYKKVSSLAVLAFLVKFISVSLYYFAIIMGFLTGDLTKYLFIFLFGITVSGAVLYKVQYDQVKVYKVLFSIDLLTIQEIEQVWHDSNLEDVNCNEFVNISVDDMGNILLNIYQLEENKLIAFYSKILELNKTKQSNSNSSSNNQQFAQSTYMLELYKKFNAINTASLTHIHQQIRYPLALRRCQNIIQQLKDNSASFAPMLFQPMNVTPSILSRKPAVRPELSPKLTSSNQATVFTMTRLDFLRYAYRILNDSLHNDLFDYLEGNYVSTLQELPMPPLATTNTDATKNKQDTHLFADIPVHNGYGSQQQQQQSPIRSPIAAGTSSSTTTPSGYYQHHTEEATNSPLSGSGSANPAVAEWQPTARRGGKNSRQSDVFDYMARL